MGKGGTAGGGAGGVRKEFHTNLSTKELRKKVLDKFNAATANGVTAKERVHLQSAIAELSRNDLLVANKVSSFLLGETPQGSAAIYKVLPNSITLNRNYFNNGPVEIRGANISHELGHARMFYRQGIMGLVGATVLRGKKQRDMHMHLVRLGSEKKVRFRPFVEYKSVQRELKHYGRVLSQKRRDLRSGKITRDEYRIFRKKTHHYVKDGIGYATQTVANSMASGARAGLTYTFLHGLGFSANHIRTHAKTSNMATKLVGEKVPFQVPKAFRSVVRRMGGKSNGIPLRTD